MGLTHLGSICKLISSGGTPSRKNPLYFAKGGTGHPWVKSKELLDGAISGTEELISEEGLRNSSAKYYPAHAVLVAMYGANVGQLGWLRMPATVNQAICALVIDDEIADWRFIFYSLLLNRADLTIQAQGAAQQNLNQDLIRQFCLDLPPLPALRRIAGILSAYDDLIENSQRRIKILEEMARRLYREWFVHFRFPGHEDCRFVESPLGEIPEGWEVKALDTLITAHIGGGWGKDIPDESHTEPAWAIRGTDIPAARSCKVADVPHRFHGASNLRSRRLTAGDIVFEVSGGSKGQPVGRSLLMTKQWLSAFDGDVICASFCKRVSPDVDACGRELLYLSFLEGYASGEIEKFQVQSTGISNFKWMEFIGGTLRVVPPAQIRSRFQAQVVPLFDQLSVLGLQIQNLRRTRDLLLPRLLSGQIDVEALDHA